MQQLEPQDTPVERNPDKEFLSDDIKRQTMEFLSRGGQIEEVPRATFTELKRSFNHKFSKKEFTKNEFRLRKEHGLR